MDIYIIDDLTNLNIIDTNINELEKTLRGGKRKKGQVIYSKLLCFISRLSK